MYQITRLFLFIMVATTIACGASRPQATGVQAEPADEPNQIFRMMGSEATLAGVDAEGTAIDVVVYAQDHIAVLGDEKVTADGQKWISVAIDRNDDSGSQAVYVRPQDLLNLPIALMTIENDADWTDSEMMTLPEVVNIQLAGYEKTVAVMRVERMTYCYKYVKQYLLKIGLVKEYLPGGSAYMAAGILPKYGFKKVARKPTQAITNDVCVYKGGPSGHGHIEIKTSKGWYYGYGYKKNPIQNRILISCFHK